MSELAARIRSERQVWAAPGSSHDRIIGVAKFALPILIGVLAAFLVMAPLTNNGDVSFVLDKNKVEMAKERLKIESAIYRGQDGKGEPFQLTAASAVQKSSAEPIVKLNDLAGQIQFKDGPAHLVADRGRYDMDTDKLMVDGPIRFQSANGYTLDTQNATVDLKTRRMTSGGAVTGQLPQGTFSANQLSADLESRDVKLDGNARLRIVPRRAK
jgi:lipopolysaccharide export system protein LptC